MVIIKKGRFSIQSTLLSVIAINGVNAQGEEENYDIITYFINLVTLILIVLLLLFLIYIIWYKKTNEYNTLEEATDSASKENVSL